jgi:hypothetical protein
MERSILEEPDIKVTNARAVIAGQTYAMANVTSVRTVVTPASYAGGLIMCLVAVVCGLVAATSPGFWSVSLTLAFGGGAVYSFQWERSSKSAGKRSSRARGSRKARAGWGASFLV